MGGQFSKEWVSALGTGHLVSELGTGHFVSEWAGHWALSEWVSELGTGHLVSELGSKWVSKLLSVQGGEWGSYSECASVQETEWVSELGH